jgi:hypothetical protein
LDDGKGFEAYALKGRVVWPFPFQVEGANQVVVGVWDDVLRHQLTDALGGLSAGLDGCLDGPDVSQQLDGDQPALNFFDNGKVYGCGFYGCVGGFDSADKSHRFDEA